DGIGRAVVALALHSDGRGVVAERLQRLAGLVFRGPHQIGQTARRHVLAGDIHQGDGAADVVGHCLVESDNIDLADAGGPGGAACKQAGEHAEKSGGNREGGWAHARKSTVRTSTNHKAERPLSPRSPGWWGVVACADEDSGNRRWW